MKIMVAKDIKDEFNKRVAEITDLLGDVPDDFEICADQVYDFKSDITGVVEAAECLKRCFDEEAKRL